MAGSSDSLTVVVVDDEAEMRSVVARLLAHLGHSVKQASDGAGALELVAAEPPDLVITDIKMPGIDGPRSASAGPRSRLS